MCVPTAYAEANGAYAVSYAKGGVAACNWWLRSPSRYQDFAALVVNSGAVGIGAVDFDLVGVRPALWIDLS